MGNLNNNQENQHGGKRVGSGRPKGSGHKPKLSDDLTKEEKEKIVKKILHQALDGDSKLLQFLAEQIYGKAGQIVELDGGATFVLEIAKQVADKYDTNTDTNSSG